MTTDTLPFPTDELRSRDGARARISRHGAHICSWRTADGRERLYLSSLAQAGPGQAIRGGIPVIFPQFAGEGPLPKHGFARGLDWEPFAATQLSDGRAQARYVLRDSPATRAIWPQRFDAALTVQLGGARLSVELCIDNIGGESFSFTAALHTYLRVADLDNLRVLGLQQLHYRDSADHHRHKQEHAAELRIENEVDRIYFAAPSTLQLCEPGRLLTIEQDGFEDVVVWNPGALKAAALPDLEAEGWRQFVCVEAAAIGKPVNLAPGARWRGRQILSAVE